MKILLKLLLSLAVLMVGIYAATPMWLPHIISSQLPPGWQLEELQAGYPGTSGINIKLLRVTGELQAAGLALLATDMRFTYRGLKSEIDSISLDVFMHAGEDGTADSPTLEDLSFLSTKLTGGLPELSIRQLQLLVHTGTNLKTDGPILVDFQAFKLRTDKDGNFHLSTLVSIEDNPEFHGQIEFDGAEYALEASGHLRAVIDGGTLTLDFELVAKREGEKVIVTLPGNTKIEYQDATGKIDELIASKVPQLRRTSQLDTVLVMEVAAMSNFVIRPGKYPSIAFNGEFELGMNSASSIANLQASELQIEITDFSNPESATINGELLLNWSEIAPFTYTLNDGGSAPMTMAADEMEIQSQLTLHDGNILSNGNGSFTGGQIQSLATSASKIELSWQELDLLNLAGTLTTETQGFSTEFDGELFTGFDFDLAYTLYSNTDVGGSGIVSFDSGFDLPIRFTGNTQAGKWSITLPPTSIKLAQLESLLAVAHFELPPSIDLTDGYINFQGDIEIDEEIEAEVTIKGYEMGVSMLESTASGAKFTFDASYGETISASGPLSIEAFALAGGIDVSNIRTELNLENTETISLKNLHADVFDGHLFLGGLRYSENRIEDAVIEMAQINLGHLLAFADIDGLEGTGKLDISLPVGSNQKGIYIKDGTFKSSRPGRLAYTKEGVAGSNIGLQALENFEYQDLSGTINYQSNGAYQIGVRLEGSNPDLYDGHPIVFNLNINGSLPALFESLFITGNFEESILNQIRSNQLE